MTEQAMYRQKAKYYDLIYSFKDYKKESRELLTLLKKHQKSKGSDLLDVGCGTGQHLAHLRTSYRCTGVDASAQMLSIAKKRCKGVAFRKQDMRKLDVKKQFDAVVSLFSAIGYVPKRDLPQTIRRMANHLKPGGVLVIDPWVDPKKYRTGSPYAQIYNGDDLSLARVNISQRQGDKSIIEFHWLVAPRNGKVAQFKDRHVTYLVPHTEILAMMRRAGLRAKKTPLMRGILIGVKA